jgi:hypothetical protein
MKTHLFLAAAVGLAIAITTSHAVLNRSLDETIQQTTDPPKDRKRSIRQVHQELATRSKLMESNTISKSSIVDNRFDGRARVLWNI